MRSCLQKGAWAGGSQKATPALPCSPSWPEPRRSVSYDSHPFAKDFNRSGHEKATPVLARGDSGPLDGLPQAFYSLPLPRIVMFCGTYDGKGRHSVSCNKMTEQMRLIRDDQGLTQGHVWNQGTEWDIFKLAVSK